MTWKKARPSDLHETVLECTATHSPEIALAIRELIERMEADWVSLGFCKEQAIFVEINCTIGHLMFLWDKKGGGAFFLDENWPAYFLELRVLWHESLNHDEGAHQFDVQAHVAICTVLENLLVEAEQSGQPERYEFYELFEGSANGSQRVSV